MIPRGKDNRLHILHLDGSKETIDVGLVMYLQGKTSHEALTCINSLKANPIIN